MAEPSPIDQSTAPLPPDSEHRGIVGLLPQFPRNLALLARFDRPIGWWLLFWPCAWGVMLAGGAIRELHLIGWMLLGALAMRGAGCVYNDIVDRDLDAQVARTAARPLASGAISVAAAWLWLTTLCAVGLLALLQLRVEAQLVALGSLALIAAYPFMKRITWWPQLWLGLVFSWGAPVGWVAVTGGISPALMWLHVGTIAWVVGYDTIYAMQDRDDDALAGIRSSALRLGGNVRAGIALFYLIALAGWGMAIWTVRPEALALTALVPAAIHLGWQVSALRQDGRNALFLFRANRFAGLLIALACFVVGSS